MNDERFDSAEPLFAEPDERPGYDEVPHPRRADETPPPAATGAGFWKALTLSLALLVVGLSWFSWSQSLAQRDLETRFTDLQARLESTGESLNASGATLTSQLKALDTAQDANAAELKKLSSAVYERTKAVVDQQGKTIANLQSEVNQANQALARANGNAEAAQAAVTALKSQVATLAASIEGIKRDSLAGSAGVDELRAQIQASRGAVGKLDEQVRGLRDSVGKSATDNRQALTAVETLRRETNLQLRAMREQMGTP